MPCMDRLLSIVLTLELNSLSIYLKWLIFLKALIQTSGDVSHENPIFQKIY